MKTKEQLNVDITNISHSKQTKVHLSDIEQTEVHKTEQKNIKNRNKTALFT